MNVINEAPTKAIRDYTTYPIMYARVNEGEILTYNPKKSPNPNGTSIAKFNTTNLKSKEVWTDVLNVRELLFYKAYNHSGTAIKHKILDINGYNKGEYIAYGFNGGAMGDNVSCYIKFSIDGGTTNVGIDKAIELGYIDPVVLTCGSFHTSYVNSDYEFLYSGNYGSTSSYPTWDVVFKPLHDDLVVTCAMKGSYSSSYNDGIYIRGTQITELSTEELSKDSATNLKCVFDVDECKFTFSWMPPLEQLASKVSLVKSRVKIPTDLTEGEVVYESEDVTICEFIDTDIKRKATYYYTLFTHKVDGSIHDKHTSITIDAASPRSFRYVRDWLNGSSANGGCHWVEIEVYSDGVNVARGKQVTHSPNDTSTSQGGYNTPSRVTDGDTNTSNYHEFPRPSNEPCYVQIDLEQRYKLEKINVRHYYQDGRRYNEAKTEVSEDGNAWYRIFDSSVSGTYAETSSGKNHIVNVLDNELPTYYDTTPTFMVGNFKADFDKAAVILTWEPPTDETVTGFVIRRTTDVASVDETDGELILETTDLSTVSVLDKKYKPKCEYSYTLYTHNSDGEYFPGSTVTVFTSTAGTSTNEVRTFTNCGATLQNGPTQSQADNTYRDTLLENKVTVLDGIQKWIVPNNGKYSIVAKGAAGGGSVSGRGAVVTATLDLRRNDVLYILVGQLGGNNGSGSAGGGGGTFIVKEDKSSTHRLKTTNIDTYVTPLVVAGGGGGQYTSSAKLGYADASTSTQGKHNGGADGGGGKINDSNGACAGGGFIENGAQGNWGQYGTSFLNGGRGGSSVSAGTPYGGFGGGASTHGNTGGGGGGGGYSGGGAGYHNDNYGNGGGGGSYSIDEHATITVNTVRETGLVEITQLITGAYFMKNSEGRVMYYDEFDNTWVDIHDDFSVDYIFSYGAIKLPYDVTKLLDGCTIIKCTDNVTDMIPYTLRSLPSTSVIYTNIDINVKDKYIVGLTVDATDEVQVLVSIDSGETFKYFNGDVWVDYEGDFIGMSVDITNTLSRNIWKKLNYDNHIRLAFIVNSNTYDEYKVKSVNIKTIYK